MSQDSPGLDRALLRLASVVVLGTIMSILDTTIVNVAIETLGRQLHSSLSSIQWVATGYLLALATVIPLTGWAMERFGGKRMWMISVTLFLVGSTLCGLAWSTESLVVFRVLQGFGGGMILPIGQAILAQAAGPQRMGRVMSVIGVPTLLGPILGPVIGGLIVDHFSWRWIFFVNLPVGALALVLAWRILPSGARDTPSRLGLVGMLLLSPGLALVVYGLSELGREGGIGPKVLVGLIGGLGFLVAFGLHAARARGRALIDLSLFRDRAFAAASGTVFIFGVSLFGAMLILPLYYQVVRGESALSAGLLLAPQGVGAAMAMPIAGRLTDRLGAGKIVPVGVIVALVGTGAFTQLTATTSFSVLAVALWVRGIGLGMTMMPSMAAAYQTLERAAVPRATSAINIIRTVGGSFGTAVLTVVLQRRIVAEIPGATGDLESLRGGAAQAAEPLAAAFGSTFWVAVGLTALALIPAWFLPRRAPKVYNLAVMKDGQLSQKDGRYELRFVRELSHPVGKVWEAVTSPAGLSAWFPFDVVGERSTGAALRFVFREGEGEPFEGSMLEYTPQSAVELAWGGDETLRMELSPSGADGCVLTLINRFDEVGKAARDAAGWHACLDALGASLAGSSIDAAGVGGEVHPAYVERFGPEAATIGPPA